MCFSAWKQSSLGVCRARSGLEDSCASVLGIWIVCELCCWSVPELLCNVCSALAHAWGTALTVLEWSRAAQCNVRSLGGCSAECVRGELLAVKRAVERNG